MEKNDKYRETGNNRAVESKRHENRRNCASHHVGRSTVYDLLALVEETGDIQPLPLLLFLIFQDGLLHVVILDN